jgi:hypothetical protein
MIKNFSSVKIFTTTVVMEPQQPGKERPESQDRNAATGQLGQEKKIGHLEQDKHDEQDYQGKSW